MVVFFSCSSTDEFAVKDKKAKSNKREKDAFKEKSAGQFVDTEVETGFSNRIQTSKQKKESDSFKTKQKTSDYSGGGDAFVTKTKT